MSVSFISPQLQVTRLLLATPAEAWRSLAEGMLMVPGSGHLLTVCGAAMHHHRKAQRCIAPSTAKYCISTPSDHFQPQLTYWKGYCWQVFPFFPSLDLSFKCWLRCSFKVTYILCFWILYRLWISQFRNPTFLA